MVTGVLVGLAAWGLAVGPSIRERLSEHQSFSMWPSPLPALLRRCCPKMPLPMMANRKVLLSKQLFSSILWCQSAYLTTQAGVSLAPRYKTWPAATSWFSDCMSSGIEVL